jgi:lipopolysaccharide export system protein LptA
MRTFFVFCIAFAARCFVLAQTNTPSVATDSLALTSTATNGATEIRSDNGGEFYYKLKTYIYRGNVRVDDPQMKLRCELLTVKSPELTNGNKFNLAIAETNVVIDWTDESGTNHATAAKAVYTYVLTNLATLPEERWQTNQTVVLSGNPFVVGGRGTYQGDPINWDRINDVISSPNAVHMTIKSDKTNSPGLFDTTMPNEKPAPNKPAPNKVAPK